MAVFEYQKFQSLYIFEEGYLKRGSKKQAEQDSKWEFPVVGHWQLLSSCTLILQAGNLCQNYICKLPQIYQVINEACQDTGYLVK